MCYNDAKRWIVEICGCPENTMVKMSEKFAAKDETVCSHSPASTAIISVWAALAVMAMAVAAVL